MISTSEFVSVGHPDKVADAVVSALLDDCLQRDPDCRFGVECQIKDNHVTLGGEVTMAGGDIAKERDRTENLVREAVEKIGYTAEYASAWPYFSTLNADDLDVRSFIGVQSPDIAQGVNADGWGDQGIFWGMATDDDERGNMPLDCWIAQKIGRSIMARALERPAGGVLGLDVKTQVETTDGEVTGIVVAVPTFDPDAARFSAREIASDFADVDGLGRRFVVNGTGAYVTHSTMGDCGTTGRKLAVDFYGGNCRVGGGCPWGKDPTKADVTLNLWTRKLAVDFVKDRGIERAYVSAACCIGRPEVRLCYYGPKMDELGTEIVKKPPSELIDELGLKEPLWFDRCAFGLFS